MLTGPTLLPMRPRGRRRIVNPLGAVYLAVFTVAGAIGALAGTTWVRADMVAVPATVLWCGALLVAGLAVSPPPRIILLSVAWLISPLLMFAATGGLWSTVLTQRGERVVATVIDVRDGNEKGRHLYYTLADQHDRRIPGNWGCGQAAALVPRTTPRARWGNASSWYGIPRAWSTRAYPRRSAPARAP